jgi:hypothetical protein
MVEDAKRYCQGHIQWADMVEEMGGVPMPRRKK